MDDNALIAELTIGQLKALIRSTVQEAVAEVLIEFSLAAEYEADMVYQAEMNELIRSTLQERLHGTGGIDSADKLDD